MDVLKFLSICYKSTEGVKDETSLVYENTNTGDSFQGIIIESYYGTFCSKIITSFGTFRMRRYSSSNENTPIEEYIKSRIQYKILIERNYSRSTGEIGPFYLVTHIDGVPMAHDDTDGFNYLNWCQYIKPNPEGSKEFAAFIKDCMIRGIIDDKCGYIERMNLYPTDYKNMVQDLLKGVEYPQYRNFSFWNEYFHIFGFLHEKKLLVFKFPSPDISDSTA